MKTTACVLIIAIILVLLSFFSSCTLPPEVRETEIASIRAIQAASHNHPIIVDTLINEQIRLRDAAAFDRMAVQVKAESQPTPDKTIAQMADFIERMKLRRKELGDFAAKLKEQNAAAIALELMMPGRIALQQIDDTNVELRKLLDQVEK